MPALSELVLPSRCAVLTMEIQRGVVGDRSSFPELAAAVSETDLVAHCARLLAAARFAGVPVVHCTAGFRADRQGSPANSPLVAAMLRRPEHLLEDTDVVELVPELGATPEDLVSHRRHGVAPFGGTDLDALLRKLGVDVVVVCGVSLNLGVIGLCVEAVDLGYSAVVARQAVTGVPREYAEAVMQHTLRLVATLADVDDIVSSWTGKPPSADQPPIQR